MLRGIRQGLGEEQPAAATGDHHPHEVVVGARASLCEQPVGVGANRLEIDREAQVAPRALEPSQVVIHGKGTAVVDANHLKGTVPPDQALVGSGNRRLGRRHDGAVE